MTKNFRRKVGYIIGEVIPEEGWDKSFRKLQTSGRFDIKTIIEILTLICKEIEKYESASIQPHKQ